MRRPLIYIAGPYTASDEIQKQSNIAAADNAGRELMLRGWNVLIPHNNTRNWDWDNRFNYEDFIYMCLDLLERCDAVCFIGDWENSDGCCKEQKHAEDCGIDVYIGLQNVPRMMEVLNAR